MTDAVETMMYAGEIPWHGLGEYVGEDAVDSTTAIRAAKLDWTVEKKGLHTTIRSQRVKVPTHVAIVRDSDDKILGVTGADYHPIQNVDAFNFMDGFGLKYETAGAIWGGRQIFLLAQMPGEYEVGKGDTVKNYLLLASSHDASLNCVVMPTAVRVVCNNTLQLALASDREFAVRIVHKGKTIEDRFNRAKDILKNSLELFRKFQDAATKLVEIPGDPIFDEYSQLVFPKPLVVGEDVPDFTTKQPEKVPVRIRHWSQRMDQLRQLYSEESDRFGPTAWSLLNATTGLVEHHSKFRSSKRWAQNESKMVVNVLGNGAKTKAQALDAMLELTGVGS